MSRLALIAVLLVHAAFMVACSSNPHSSTAGSSWAQDSNGDRLIVVTIRSQAAPVAPRAGSTARAYAEPSQYALSPATVSMARAVANTYGLKEVTGWPIGILGVYCLVYALPEGADRTTALEQLRKDARVESAQPLNSFQTLSSESNDPYGALQNNLTAMNVHRAHRWSQGAGIRVAVVDTSIDLTHPDLVGRIASQRDFVSTSKSLASPERHGTAIAGVIAANANNATGIIGVAPGARILAYRACWHAPDSGGEVCNTLTLAKALVAAIDAKAHIVNLSLGGPTDALLSRLVRAGIQRGMFFVGAMPRIRAESFPTSIAGVIAVDVIEDSSTADATVFAPGKEVLTLTPNGSYDFVSGSSIAAANVSGALALLLAEQRRLTANQVRTLLSAPGGQRHSIDLCLALTQLRKQGTCE